MADDYFQAYADRVQTLDYPGASHDGLPDHSLEALRRWHVREDTWLARLERVDEEGLWGSPAWPIHASLLERLRSSAQFRVCRRELWRVDPDWGWHIDDALPTVARLQPVGTPQARRAALRRWGGFDGFVDVEIQNLREGLRHGYSAPRLLVEAVIRQVGVLADQAPTESPFADPARRDSSAEFRARYLALVEDEILPSLERYQEFLADEYLPQARAELAITALPDGLACYRAFLRRSTTLALDESQVDSIGRALMAEATAERDQFAREWYALDQGRALSEAIAADTSLRWSSHSDALAVARRGVGRAASLLPSYFGGMPDVPSVVVDTLDTQVSENAGFGAYYDPAPAGKPGPHRVMVNPQVFDLPGAKGILEILMFHEGSPGHHLQTMFGRAYSTAHPYSLFIEDGDAGFVEGWASYAQGPLAREMGLYSDAALLVASELRVWDRIWFPLTDGIHMRGWTAEQAGDTVRAYISGLEDGEIRNSILQTAATPGYNLSYSLGALEIERLRDLAERQLGSEFDVREFHNQVLRYGEIPLPALRVAIQRWADSTAAGRTR